LVELDGGKWDLVAQCQPLASPQSFRATVVPSGHANEGKSEQGEVGAWSLCRLGSGGGVVVELNAGWGYLMAEEEEKRNGGSPQDLLGLLPSFVSRSYRTRARAGV
jgi:hypothetical protein